MSPKEKAVNAVLEIIAEGCPVKIEQALNNLYEKGYYAGWNNNSMGGNDMTESIGND